MNDITRAAEGMAAVLRERCPGCKARLRVETRGDGAWHVGPGILSLCRLYDDERRALAFYEAAQ
jgi:hypothetical protein